MRKKYGKTLQERADYRIVRVVMNIKQTMLTFAVLSVSSLAVVSSPLVANAVLDNNTGSNNSEPTPSSAGTGSGSATNTCGGAETAIIKCDADNTGKDINNNGIWALLIMVINIMTAGIGILAVGGIVYGAILYTTAEDKADQVKQATGIITNVVIGLILYALMWVTLNFLVPGGVFAQ